MIQMIQIHKMQTFSAIYSLENPFRESNNLQYCLFSFGQIFFDHIACMLARRVDRIFRGVGRG